MRSFVLAASLLLAGPAVLPAQQPAPAAAPAAAAPSVTLPAELDRVLRDYERGWVARDARALAELFSHDGFVLRMGSPPVRGRAAIEEAYRGAGGPLHLRALAFESDGSVGYVIGGFSSAAGRPDDGKFVLTLRKSPAGRWEITADIDNPNSMRRRGPGGATAAPTAPTPSAPTP